MPRENWFLKLELEPWLNDPKLRRLSRENRATWLDALLMMKREDTYFLTGEKRELANQLHLSIDEFEDFIADMKRTKAGDVTVRPNNVRIVSRRYKREHDAREYERIKKQQQRVPTMSPDCPPAVPANPLLVTSNKITNNNKNTNGETPRAAKAAVTASTNLNDPWNGWLELLTQNANMTEAQARPFLGRLAKDFGKDLVMSSLADARAAIATEKPVDPKSFLIGVVRQRDKSKTAMYVGSSAGVGEMALPEPCEHCGSDVCLKDHRFDAERPGSA